MPVDTILEPGEAPRIARWLTPLGRTIDQVGLTPGVAVPLTAADKAAGRDPQLDKAISILSGQASPQP